MNSNNNEICRIRGEVPNHIEESIQPDETIEVFEVVCPSNADEVLRVARQVLVAILQNQHKSDLREKEWEVLLDEKFVKRCGPHPTKAEQERWASLSLDERILQQRDLRWSLQMFINSFDSKLGLRKWYWWDANVINQSLIEITVVVPWDMFLWRSLRWLFIGSGADEVRRSGNEE